MQCYEMLRERRRNKGIKTKSKVNLGHNENKENYKRNRDDD